jgi:hypothetical protein
MPFWDIFRHLLVISKFTSPALTSKAAAGFWTADGSSLIGSA